MQYLSLIQSDLSLEPATVASLGAIRNSCFSALFSVSLSICSIPALADACVGKDPALCTIQPFTGTTAIDNLRRCIDVSPQDAYDLSRIRRYFYEFTPPKGVVDDTAAKVVVERAAEIEVKEFNLNSFARAVESLRWGNCETDIKISNVSVSLDSNNHINIGYHFRGDYRVCGHFLGIPYKDDAGSNWADVSLKYEIDSNFKLNLIERNIYNQGEDRNPFHQALRFILPSMGAVGAVLSAGISRELDRISVGSPDPGALASLGQKEFLAITSGITAADRFADQLGELQAPVYTYSKVPERTGVLDINWDSSRFRYSEKTEILPDLGVDYYNVKTGEVHYINELRHPRPRLHTVRAGENLWSIADRYYRIPKMFTAIERNNNISNGRIYVGQKLYIPDLSDLCDLNNDQKLVKPGDNIWAIKRRLTNYQPRVVDFRSRRLNLIYPYEELILDERTAAR